MTSFWHDLPKPFFILAPMEAVTDVVFRHVITRAGRPDIYFTEFANATGWVHAGDKAIAGRLVKTDDESPIVAQIWGGEPGDMEAFVQHCATLGYDGIDINMGCPAKSAVKSGGSALIRKPDVAVAAIKAAKSVGLPVSVKTRLGYTGIDEWHDWLTTLLRQDIVALTIHLRTKKEMSKVPAHYELIPAIKQLRDEIAPQTLLIINGDIRDRTHGLELVERYGVDGVMIGRGVFHNPFCFAKNESVDEPLSPREGFAFPAKARQERQLNQLVSRQPEEGDEGRTTKAQHEAVSADCSDTQVSGDTRKQQLLTLLQYHLDQFDYYQPQMGRPFETLKRFFKIYIRDFDGASDLRDKLMHTKSTDEVRALLHTYWS